MVKEKKPITAEDVFNAIESKFDDPQRFAVLREVNEGTGYRGRSWIDALVISLWPSDGLIRSAFEIKISRGDFISELKKGGKNEFFKKCCHEFWYATAKDVVKSEDEIPEGCGWMVMRGKRLVIKKHAKIKRRVKADDMFWASIVRSCFNATGLKRKNLINEIRNGDDYKEKMRVFTAVKKYLHRNGHKHWYPYDKTVDEIESDLNTASPDKAQQENIEQIRQCMVGTREAFQKFLVKIFPLACHLLTNTNEDGHFILDRYGSTDEKDLYPILHDLFKILKKRSPSYRYDKKYAREAMKFFKKLVDEKE